MCPAFTVKNQSLTYPRYSWTFDLLWMTTLVSPLREHACKGKILGFSSLLALIRACSFQKFCLFFQPAFLLEPAQLTIRRRKGLFNTSFQFDCWFEVQIEAIHLCLLIIAAFLFCIVLIKLSYLLYVSLLVFWKFPPCLLNKACLLSNFSKCPPCLLNRACSRNRDTRVQILQSFITNFAKNGSLV